MTKNRLTKPQGIAAWCRCERNKLCRSSEIVRPLDNAGRTYPGWQHHVVLTAVAHAYIQRERMRRGAIGLTFPAVRAIVQEIFTGDARIYRDASLT